MKNTVGVIQWC